MGMKVNICTPAAWESGDGEIHVQAHLRKQQGSQEKKNWQLIETKN